MAHFSESMKAFTGRLQASIDDRSESLADVRRATTDLLDGAREFLDDVAMEHELRTEQVRAFMANSRADRLEAVKTMQNGHCESHEAMAQAMRQSFDETTRGRVEEVKAMLSDSRANRLEASRAMMESHREELSAMRETLHQTLDDANEARLEAVGMMRETFQAARHELASDLRDAAMAWKQFASRSPMPMPVGPSKTEALESPPMSSPPQVKTKVMVAEPEPAKVKTKAKATKMPAPSKRAPSRAH